MNDTTHATPGQVYNVLRSGAVADELVGTLTDTLAHLTGMAVPPAVQQGFRTHLQAQINNMAMSYMINSEGERNEDLDPFSEAIVETMVEDGLDIAGVCSDMKCPDPQARFRHARIGPFTSVDAINFFNDITRW